MDQRPPRPECRSGTRRALRRVGSGARTALLTSLAALAAGCSTAPASAPPIWMGQVAGNEHSLAAPVRDWKTMKFDGIVRQQTEFSCGAAVLATIFNEAFGHHTTERQVLVNMLKVADPDLVAHKGFSLLDMKNYTRAVGLRGDGFRVDYAAMQQLKVPAIALINIRGYKHFVVIRKADAAQVMIGDPALGNRVMTRPAFERAWNQVLFVVTGPGFDPNTALIHPPPPLSAHQLYGQRSPIFNADTAEFGFTPAFSFQL